MNNPYSTIRYLYKIGYKFTEPGLYCIGSDKKGFNEYRFYDDKWIDVWPEGIEFIFDGSPIEDFLIGGLHWKLVSERVREVFMLNKVELVQFLPIKTFYRKKEQDLGVYWVLNVIRSVKGLNWKTVQNLDCFRRSTTIFISNNLKQQLEIAKAASGAVFYKVSPKSLGIEV